MPATAICGRSIHSPLPGRSSCGRTASVMPRRGSGSRTPPKTAAEDRRQIDHDRKRPRLHLTVHLPGAIALRGEDPSRLADRQPQEHADRPPCPERPRERGHEQGVEQQQAQHPQHALAARHVVHEGDGSEEAGGVHQQELHQHRQHDRLDRSLAECERRRPHHQAGDAGRQVGQGAEQATRLRQRMDGSR